MKKTLSVVLALIMTIGLLPVSGFAAAPQGVYRLGLSGTNSAFNTYTLERTARPDDEIGFYIFLDGKHALRQNIRSDKIDVKQKASKGNRAVEKLSIKYDNNGYAYVNVEFLHPYVSTKEMEFVVTLYLTSGKNRITTSELELVGTLENYEQTVDENSGYANATDYPVIEADDYIKSIQVDLGQGLSIHSKMFSGKRYYAYATQSIRPEDDAVLTRYPSIDTVYYLQTVNFANAGNYVQFDLGSKLYVYNTDLKYIGTTNDKLPYSPKYYLSSVELDIGQELNETDSIPNNSNTENVPSGGDDVPPNNNKNPGTGR